MLRRPTLTRTSMHRSIAPVTLAGLVIALSGSTGALADQSNNTQTREGSIVTEWGGRVSLADLDAMRGVALENPNGESLGEISDFMIDQSTGTLIYAIADVGGFLGLGEKSIAIPYHEIRWTRDHERAIVEMTEEQADRTPEFDATRTDVESDAWRVDFESIYGWVGWDDTDDDPYLNRLSQHEATTLEGSVVDVNRGEDVGDTEQVVVTIRTRDGAERRVILGPAHYVMGATNPPMRGDWASIEAYRVEDDARWIARTYAAGAKTLTLRDGNGNGAWLSKAGSRPANDRGYTRFALADALIGDEVTANLEDVGEVQDLIFDRISGTVVFLILDPDENFLGIADTLRMIPWPAVATINDDRVVLDATNSMVHSARVFPDDASELDDFRSIDFAYRVFSVEPTALTRGEMRGPGIEGRRVVPSHSMWARDGELVRRAASAPTETYRGTVMRIRTDRIEGDAMKTLVVEINTDAGMRAICLGPADLIDRERLGLEDDEPVEVRASEVHFGNRTLLIGESILVGGEWMALRAGHRQGEGR